MENKYGHFFREGEAVVMKRNGKVVWFVDGFRTIADFTLLCTTKSEI